MKSDEIPAPIAEVSEAEIQILDLEALASTTQNFQQLH